MSAELISQVILLTYPGSRLGEKRPTAKILQHCAKMIRADQILSSWGSYWVTKTASLPMSLPRPLYRRCHNIWHHWESQGLGRGQWASSSSPRIPFSFLLCAQIETMVRPAQRWKYLGLQVHPTWNQQGGWVDKALASQDWRSTPKPALIRSLGRGSCDRQLPSLPSLSKDSSPSWPALGSSQLMLLTSH